MAAPTLTLLDTFLVKINVLFVLISILILHITYYLILVILKRRALTYCLM